MFEVSHEEIKCLIEREKFYQLVDVSEKIESAPGTVSTFICSQSEIIDNSVILKKYLNIIILASEKFPFLVEQIQKEYLEIHEQEVLDGSFLSITGKYDWKKIKVFSKQMM